MPVTPDAYFVERHRGRPYHFCSEDCRMKFLADPDSFVAPREVV